MYNEENEIKDDLSQDLSQDDVSQEEETWRLIACERCGRLFKSKDGQTICKKCLNEDTESDFKKVRSYLYFHPGAGIKEVVENTGVDEMMVLKFLRDGRIKTVDEDKVIKKCKICGKIIESGEICESCRDKKIKKGLKQAANEMMKEDKTEEEIEEENNQEKSVKKYGKYHTRFFSGNRRN